MSVVFYFDVVCPFAYLASLQIDKVAHEQGATVEWKPVLLGGIYNAVNPSLNEEYKQQQTNPTTPTNKKIVQGRDLFLQANRLSVALQFPDGHPRSSLLAQRLLSVLSPDLCRKIAQLLYRAYWVENLDISEEETFAKIIKRVLRTDPKSVIFLANNQRAKDKLRANTEEAISRGVFGVPSFYLPASNRLFFGGDRLHFVAWELQKAAGRGAGRPKGLPVRLKVGNGTEKREVRVYHDFASPWSYIGSTQIERIASESASRVVWKPIVLGALFKATGTPNVPMAVLSPARREYNSQDIQDWTSWWGNVPFQFTSTFPLRSITALRLSIVEPRLIHPLYRAAWAENINIGEKEELRKIITKEGFNAEELLEKAEQQNVKDDLRQNTEEAVRFGLCGVPTFLFRSSDNDSNVLFLWGQDRLHVVADILAGWTPSTTSKL